MMRSLYSGVSGLKNHQTRMDVIGNNIANVNTTAFKASRTIFQDIYSQTLKSASAGTDNAIGGTNPSQVGLGVKLARIDMLFNSAPTARTDNPSDLAIEGDGFFIVQDMNTTPPSQYYTRAGNFYIDNRGDLVTGDGYYVMGYTYTDATGQSLNPTYGKINIQIPSSSPPEYYSGISFGENGDMIGLNAAKEEIKIARVAIATFSNNNGLEKVGGSFYRETNNSGKPMSANNNTDHLSGVNGAGKINAGGLEMSNVDLANEFTDMIITQRGFQANSRIITVSDSMLEELTNLKR